MTRTCKTYNYWHDLWTDMRKPVSWLDFANMFLRRVRLILIRTDETWRLREWFALLDDIHTQDNCNLCKRGNESEKGNLLTIDHPDLGRMQRES